ncbi:MAG: RIP metalloprotease RseP, partial [Planctomycetes bacterium]|nr:RIP metalloprotease RseP [Planctomycetota bacterium]
MIALYIVYALVGISLIIFLHELGHFIAARRVGVRVERFAIGFDPPFRGKNLRLFWLQRGDTEYVLGVIPFGGYVKLAGGEMAPEPGKAPAPDELPAKSVGARTIVFAAGSLMNVLSALVFFMVAFAMGVPFPEPKVGMVEPGSPAWEAGLQPGDEVLAMDGEEVLDFNEVRLGVALARRDAPLRLTVRSTSRGAPEEREVHVAPRWSPEHGYNVIGVEPTYSGVLEKPEPGSLAERSGLREGDSLTGIEVAGNHLASLPPGSLLLVLGDLDRFRPAEPFKLDVLREGRPVQVEVPPRKAERGKRRPQLGVLPGEGNIVRAVHPGSGAREVLRPGDQVLAVDGEPVHVVHLLLVLERWKGKDGKLELSIAGRDGATRLAKVDREALLAWLLRNEVHWDRHSALVASIAPGALLEAAGLKPGDLITAVDGKPLFGPEDFEQVLRSGGEPDPTVSLEVRRGGAVTTIKATRRGILEAAGVEWQTMPPIAAVTTGGPADSAGIGPGSTILRIGATSVRTWKAMVEALAVSSGGDSVDVAWRTASGEEKQATVVLGIEPVEPIGLPLDFLQKSIRAKGLEPIRLGLRRTVITAEQIFLTLKSLLRREVSAKNLSGPVGITHLLTKVAERNSLSTLIYYLALISVYLGL